MASAFDRAVSVGYTRGESRPVSTLAGGVITELFIVPMDCVLTGIGVTCETQPTTAGVYTLAVTDETGANNLLSAATESLDATITANTYLASTLTATAADRLLAQDTVVSAVFTSDNQDLVGDGLVFHLRYNAR